MRVTIVHDGGEEKVVAFEGFVPPFWAQVRYPNGAGCYLFHCQHGRIEIKASEVRKNQEPRWRLLEDDRAKLEALAREAKLKPRKQPTSRSPRTPRKKPASKQVGMGFE